MTHDDVQHTAGQAQPIFLVVSNPRVGGLSFTQRRIVLLLSSRSGQLKLLKSVVRVFLAVMLVRSSYTVFRDGSWSA